MPYQNAILPSYKGRWLGIQIEIKLLSKDLLECSYFYVFYLHKWTCLTCLLYLPFTSVWHLVQPSTKTAQQQESTDFFQSCSDWIVSFLVPVRSGRIRAEDICVCSLKTITLSSLAKKSAHSKNSIKFYKFSASNTSITVIITRLI